MPEGYLLFSDPNTNTIYRWSDTDGLSVFRTKSGYTGVDIAEYGQPGSNGLALDRDGRLTIDEHGNRRVTRLEKNGSLTVLADHYDGKRLNSPNDSSTSRTDRSTSPTRRSACRRPSRIRAKRRRTAACIDGQTAGCSSSPPT